MLFLKNMYKSFVRKTYPQVTKGRLKLNNIRAMFGLIQRNTYGQWQASIQLLLLARIVQTNSSSRIAGRSNASFTSWTNSVDLTRKAAFRRNDFLLGIVVRI